MRIVNLEGDDEPIKMQLRYVFAIIGLRKLPSKESPFDDVPSDEAVLLEFIHRNYGNYHPLEIRAAFELAIQGKLKIKTEFVNHYQDFNCAYFGRIMAAYRPYRENLLAKVEKAEQEDRPLTPEENLKHKKESMKFFEEGLLVKYQSLVDGKPYQLGPLEEQFGYYNMKRIGIFMKTNEEKKEIYRELRPMFVKYKYPAEIISKTKLATKQKVFRLWIQEKAFEGFDLRTEIEQKLCAFYSC